MQAAPLWDPVLCQFVGLLTVTDFIDILRHYRSKETSVADLSTRSIADILNDGTIWSARSFRSADTTTSLKQACKLLHRHSLDYLPIMFPEDMRVLATITYTNILEHLVTHFREQRRLFDDTIYDLGIGTYGDKLITIAPDKTLGDALEVLHEHNLSAVPIVNEHGKLLSVYSRSDITFLASASDAEDSIQNLDLRLDALPTDRSTPDALHTCSPGHTLQSIFEYFAQLRFNRLFVVDENERAMGVVSARDLVAYFLEE